MAKLPATRNQLLERLLRLEPSLAAHLTCIAKPAGAELQQLGRPIRHLFFPAGGVVSMLVRLRGGEAAEVSVVGREGLAGLSALLGAGESLLVVQQQVPGPVLCLPIDAALTAQRSNLQVGATVGRYAAFVLRSTQQLVACNAVHPLEARSARWILMTADRAGAEEFLLTQELLAMMLGVARQSLNRVVMAFREAGLIEYRRGRLQLLNRARLERRACECYGLVREFYEMLVG